MFGNHKFATLLSPFRIGPVEIKNRIVKSPQASGNATKDGAPSDGAMEYYESLAKGGVGLITVEGAAVDFPIGVVGWPRLGIQDDSFIPRYRQLTDLIHSYGAKTFLEMQHAGPSHPKSMANLQPVAPSALSGDEKPVRTFDNPRALTIPEIKNIQLLFLRAAERAQKAGFDGIDLHGAHRYLINAFLSKAWNKRDDEYGGQTRENRARFVTEIIRALKSQLGKEYPVGIRFNVAEWGLKDGLTLEDGIAFAKLFEEAGADFVDISGYGYGRFLWGYWGEQLRALEPAEEVKPWLRTIESPGFIISQAAQVKKAISIPVISGGRVEPGVANRDIEKGKIDLVFFARRLIADPSFPNKLAEGRWWDVAPCTGCLECWDSTTTLHRSVQCRINASCGREHEYEIRPAEQKKKVWVVGGGPAGMEAARVAALRGHDVTLYEKQSILGGQLPLAAMIKGTEIEDLTTVVRYLKLQMAEAGVKVKLGRSVTRQLVEEQKPDAVVLAVGGVPAKPSIPGIEKTIVVPTAKLHRQSKALLRFFSPRVAAWLTKFWMPLGKRIVVIGGGIQGCELAEFLVKRGRTVTMVDSAEKFGGDMVVILSERLVNWLKKKGVVMMGGVKIEEVTDTGLKITTKEGAQQNLAADNILLALPLAANNALFASLKGNGREIYEIGDGREPHRIIHAIHDGSRAGRLI